MSDSPPPSLLITPDTRRRLQQQYDEAVRLMSVRQCDFARVHDLLAECLRTDPASTLYLDALMANLRRWQPKPERSWLPRWLGGAKGSGVFRGKKPSPSIEPDSAKDSRPPEVVLQNAPDLLRDRYSDAATLRKLAQVAGECEFDDIELRYWRGAAEIAPNQIKSLRGLARCLTRQGRFDEAQAQWLAIARTLPDEEAAQAQNDLQSAPSGAESVRHANLTEMDTADIAGMIAAAEAQQRIGMFSTAEELLQLAQSAGGGDFRIHRAREALQLARSAHRIEIAKRRAAADSHPKAQSLVGRLEQEHNRLEIDIFHVRSERHPDDLSLRLELARRLKKAGNYSGAIQRLEEARADPALAAAVLLELGECWQHLRQFGKSLELYRHAVEREVHSDETPVDGSPRPLVGALYRIGVLAAAMDQSAEAKVALTRLLAIDPDYKDARQRLDNLP